MPAEPAVPTVLTVPTVPVSSVTSRRLAAALAALLGIAGTTHFVMPAFYDEIVPHALPGTRRMWTLVSGVAELVCAGLVARPRTRRFGATCAALLFVAVFPANLQMAWDWRHKAMRDQAVAIGRLPVQIPLVLLALRVRRGSK